MPPTSELMGRMAHRRAVEALIWGMPAVNADLMFQAMARAVRGDWNQVVYWSRLVDWKNQTLTPNPDAIYIMPFFNTAQTGPMVLEIPAAGEGSITGSIMDSGKRRSRMSGRPVSTKGRAADISSCLPVIPAPYRTVTSPFRHRPIRATPCCARF